MDYPKWANQQIDRMAEPRGRTAVIKALCKRLDITKATLYGRLREETEFSPTEIIKMAEFFGVDSPIKGKHSNHTGHAQTLGNVIPLLSGPRASFRDWISYPLLGEVKAGAFMESDLLSQVEPREHPGPRYSSYPNATPMAWEAHGDSMNASTPYPIFDGTILFGVDFQEAGGTLANDMIVVVEQNRGGLIERSVKAVAIFPDRTEFQPRSTNPIHKPIIYKNGNRDDNVEVRILTVVHGTYNSL